MPEQKPDQPEKPEDAEDTAQPKGQDKAWPPRGMETKPKPGTGEAK